MDWLKSQMEIESELLQIEQSFFNPLVSYDRIIAFCQKTLVEYRTNVTTNGFPDEASEIKFFKRDKPFVYGILLQYAHQLSFELDFPDIAFGRNEDIINKKIQEITAFLSSHKDMILYLELESKTFDSQFFLRKNRGLVAYPDHRNYSFDPEFCTSHDVLIAQILGYQGFQQYLHNKLGQYGPSTPESKSRFPKMQWTGSKVALTELGFALYHSGVINHGNASLKTVMRFLEQVTTTDLGDYHHTSIRLRNRSNPTKFVDKLKNSLLNWMAELDS